MNLSKLAAAILLLMLALFCAFGALASLEPRADGGADVGWLAGYCVTGIAALVAAVNLIISGRRRRG